MIITVKIGKYDICKNDSISDDSLFFLMLYSIVLGDCKKETIYILRWFTGL